MTKYFTKKHLKILKPTSNVVNVNINPTSIHVSGDSGDNSSEVLNLSCDQNNRCDPVDVVVKTEYSSVSHVQPKKRGRPNDYNKEKQ